MNPTERPPERQYEPLSAARFQALAEAYGGDIARWPIDVREAAALTLAETPALAAGLLADESALDAALDAWRPSPTSHRLQQAILQAAPAPRRAPVFGDWLRGAGLGAGLAAACAAGVVVGAQLTTLSQPPAEVNVLAAALKGYETNALGDAQPEVAG